MYLEPLGEGLSLKIFGGGEGFSWGILGGS